MDSVRNIMRKISAWVARSDAWWIAGIAVGWLILISCLHFWLNVTDSSRKTVRIGYMPVITNLAVPLLDHATMEGDGIRFQAVKFASFAEMAESLRNDSIQAAFMIAPLSIVLHQQGEDVKIVYIGNRNESTLVARKALNVRRIEDLIGKTLAVPMRYSGHNLGVLQLMEEAGLSGRINIVEMNPPDMASALAAGSLDAYFVGEPFAAQTLKNGEATLLHYVEDFWKHFICNLAVVKQSLIEQEPETVRLLVEGAARSGIWARSHREQAAEIATRYWNQPQDLVEYALDTPTGRIVYDRFTPKEAEIQQMADLMVRYSLLENSNIDGLVEDRFARRVGTPKVSSIEDIIPKA